MAQILSEWHDWRGAVPWAAEGWLACEQESSKVVVGTEGVWLCSYLNAGFELGRLPFLLKLGGMCGLFMFKVTYLFGYQESYIWDEIYEPENGPLQFTA